MRFGAAHHDFRRADAEMQGAMETAAAHQFDPFSDTKAQRVQTLLQAVFCVDGANGGVFAGFQVIQTHGVHQAYGLNDNNSYYCTLICTRIVGMHKKRRPGAPFLPSIAMRRRFK